MAINLAAIRARAEAATEGPWEWCGNSLQRCGNSAAWVMFPGTDGAGAELVWSRESGNVFPDATFIAHARADVPALCDEVERLRSERARLDAALHMLYAQCESPDTDPDMLNTAMARARAALEGSDSDG